MTDTQMIHVDPRFLDRVWPKVEAMLATAIAYNHGEHTIDQLRAEIAYGGSNLLVQMDGEDVIAVATVQFKQYPGFRTAWVSYLAGKTSAEAWDRLKAWSSDNGASFIECLCDESHARLFDEYGFKDTYHLMRCEL